MRAAESWLRERGIRKVELMIRDTNTEVAAFYARLGYGAEPDACVDLIHIEGRGTLVAGPDTRPGPPAKGPVAGVRLASCSGCRPSIDTTIESRGMPRQCFGISRTALGTS